MPPPFSRSLSSSRFRFPSTVKTAFSLIEVLAAVAIIGIITFIAIPNIVRIKEESERSLAVSRAEALNLGMASFIQANGRTAASSLWSAAESQNSKYTLIAPYLAFAPEDLDNYMPEGYSATLPESLLPLTKTTLTGPSGTLSY